MTEHIDVPASALERKPFFPEFPPDDLVREIKHHVATTGRPESWWGHTHDAPPKGGLIEYVEEFDIPDIPGSDRKLAPCPCCTPFHGKYKHKGKIAYFREEQVIRLIGPRCYRSCDPDGHDEAVKVLRKRQNRERELRYIATRLPHLPEMIRVAEDVLNAANARDALAVQLHNLDLPLWASMRTGELQILVSRRKTRVLADGTEQTVTEQDYERHAAVKGFGLLNPTRFYLATRVEVCVEMLREASRLLGENGELKKVEDHLLQNITSRIRQAQSGLNEALRELADQRQFISAANLATLNAWGRRNNAVMSLAIARSGRALLIGKHTGSMVTIPLPVVWDQPLPRLPKIAPGLKHGA